MPTPRNRAHLVAELAAAGAGARTQPELRLRALELLSEALPFDAAFFHALSPRVPLATGVAVGIPLARIAATMAHWDRLAVELEPLRTHALEHGGVVSDGEALPAGSRVRASFERTVAKPLGVRRLAIVHLSLRERFTGAVLLMRKRAAQPFTPNELALLRALVPVLSLADAAHEPGHAQPASLPTRLRCLDQRLTERQREIVEHVAMGHTNAAIARALEVSPNTLRNHLVAVFQRLGAANRADVVRLAVLR